MKHSVKMCIYVHSDGWHVAAVASWVPTKQLCFHYNSRKELVVAQILPLLFMHGTNVIMESQPQFSQFTSFILH
jgi:hypothetical protein